LAVFNGVNPVKLPLAVFNGVNPVKLPLAVFNGVNPVKYCFAVISLSAKLFSRVKKYGIQKIYTDIISFDFCCSWFCWRG
jgi:hypothetical protein